MNFVDSRALRVLALAVAFTSLASSVTAGPAQPSAHVEAPSEPFGFRMLLPSGGAMLEKWLTVWRQWKDEKQALEACRNDRERCGDPAALELLAIVDAARTLTGLARLGQINRAINLSIKPVSDLVAHGVMDVWSSPLATLGRRAGDCEDYAILKFAVLLEAGFSPVDLRVLIVRDSIRSEDHAVLAVRHESKWLLLDNRRHVIRSDAELANYQPLMQMDGTGARRYLEIAIASGAGPNATPAVPEIEPSALSSLPW